MQGVPVSCQAVSGMTEQRSDLLLNLPAVIGDADRIAVLKNLVSGTPHFDPDFQDIAELAANALSAPIAVVTLIDATHQWFVARVGTDLDRLEIQKTFGAYVIADPAAVPLIVRDASRDPRFAGEPCVVNPPHLRFYAGAPIIIDNHAVGTVAIMDSAPRMDVDDSAAAQLRRLAALAARLLAFKEEARRRAETERALSRDEHRHAMALEAANVGSWLWDVGSGVISFNAAMGRMFGVSSTSLTSREVFEAVHPDDRSAMLDSLRAAIAEDAEYSSTFRVQATGRWVQGRGRVHERGATGRPETFLGVNIDVTAEQMTAQRTKLLLREANHRVKNTLAMLQSLARQTLRQTSDPQEFMTAFAGRLQAISEAHGLLSDHEWGEIRLSALISKQLAPHVRDYEKQVEIHKDEISLGPDQAVGLGLVLHELATNAYKYGSLSTARGRVVITARKMIEDQGRVLHLTWSEVGGPPVKEPSRRGFGSILIERSLDKVMGSQVKVEYLPTGVTAIVRMPLT